VLLGQTGTRYTQWHTGETIVCYTQEELLKIANTITKGNEALELNVILNQQLVISEQIIEARMQELFAKDKIITEKDTIINLKEDIITGKDQEIKELNSTLKTSNRKLKWTKLKWGTTSVLLSAGLVYFLIN